MEWELVKCPQSGVPEARNCHAVCTRGNKIYSFGGVSKTFINELRIFDKEKPHKGWVVPPTNLEYAPSPRQSAAAAIAGKDMYVFGGSTKTRLFNDIYKFDTEILQWSHVKTEGRIPSARDRHSMACVGGKLVVFGGHCDESEYCNDLYQFDLEKRRWSVLRSKTRSPTPRYDHTMIVFDDFFVIFGGKYASGCFNDVHIFSMRTHTWSHPEVLGICPAGRWGHAGVATGRHMIVYGGWNGTWCFNDLHVLDIEALTWQRIQQSEDSPSPRAFHSIAVCSQTLVVFGGRNRKTRMNDTFTMALDNYFKSPTEELDDMKHEQLDALSEQFSKLGHGSLQNQKSRPPVDPTGRYKIPDRWKIRDFDLLDTLGTGSFGRVRFCKYLPNGKFYAMKMLKKFEIIRLKQENHILSEKEILCSINHPFIVNMVGYFQDKKYLYFVLEYIPGGEFFTHLRRAGRFKLRPTVFYASQIVLIFQYLHSIGVVYRDLKPENLLVDRDGNLKLTDFGFAKQIETRTWTLCGTPEYIAPEILLNKGHGKSVDWWALGILIYEMLAGNPPFIADDPMGIYQQILAGKIEFPNYIDSFARELICELLTSDITKRLGNLKNGVEDIKNHPFFVGVDWEACYNKELRPPFRPEVSGHGDTHNFEDYPSSDEEPPDVILTDDPFKEF